MRSRDLPEADFKAKGMQSQGRQIQRERFGMRTWVCLISVVMLVVVMSGCGKKEQAATVAGWQQYQDPYYGIRFEYPQGWQLTPEGGRFSMYSSPEVVSRFYDFTVKGRDGARLVISYTKMDPIQSLDQYGEQLRGDLGSSGFDVTSSGPATLIDLPATRVDYRGAVDQKNTIEGIQVSAVRDSMLLTVKYEGFNKTFGTYKPAIDTALATLFVPGPKMAGLPEETEAPSTEFTKFDNERLSVSYPNNFSTTFPRPKAPVEFSMEIKGYRQDSYVHIDIMPAEGLTADKVVAQNAKFYREASRGTATIDGVATTYINYSPMKDISSRVYFLVKTDKVYRIIINYYTPMREAYLPAFEKTVGSIAVK